MQGILNKSSAFLEVHIASFGDEDSIQKALKSIGVEIPTNNIWTPSRFGRMDGRHWPNGKLEMLKTIQMQRRGVGIVFVDDNKKNCTETQGAGFNTIWVNTKTGINHSTLVQIFASASEYSGNAILVLDFDCTITKQHATGLGLNREEWESVMIDTNILRHLIPNMYWTTTKQIRDKTDERQTPKLSMPVKMRRN